MTDTIPEKFYKYRPFSDDAIRWIERIVLHNEIYFAPALTFNDPFDVRAVFDFEAAPDHQRADFLRMSRKYEPYITEAQHQAAADRVVREALSPENIAFSTATFQFMHNRLMTAEMGVYCVSTKCDDVLMWAHYADSHKGVCLEFDGLSDLMAPAQQVVYLPDRPSINPYRDSPAVMMERSFLTKAEQWAYESEWRLLRSEGPGKVGFNAASLTGIIIGALAPARVVEKVSEWCQHRDAPITLSRAAVDPRKFKLNITPVRRS
jgi:hypothetical protein